jgi:serine/threonine protein kinase
MLVEVYVLSGPRAGEKLGRFDPLALRIGAGPDQDLDLSADRSTGVAPRHAEIVRARGGYQLNDCGSGSGTFVLPDDRPIRQLPLGPVTLVRLGAAGPLCRIQVGRVMPFGRYLITGRIGGGGMAEVFAARGPGHLGRSVALKVVHHEMFSMPAAAEMFLHEARVAAQVSHHNVIKVYDVGEERGVLYIAMEHLRAVTLHELQARLLRAGKAFPPDLAAALVSQALYGLHAAHELRDEEGRPLRVVHRDISPSNLLCTQDGLVVVIDFGVARADLRLHQSLRGLKGKPSYMAPEQVRGEQVDRRTDVFAAAVVLYELCAGQRLFMRDNIMATLDAVLRGQVPPLRSVCRKAPQRLAALVERALSPAPEARPESAAAFAAELDQIVADSGGRFAKISDVAAYLAENGVSLLAPPPSPLLEVPAALRPAPHEDVSWPDPSGAGAAQGGGTIRLDEEALDPLDREEAHQTHVDTPGDERRDVAAEAPQAASPAGRAAATTVRGAATAALDVPPPGERLRAQSLAGRLLEVQTVELHLAQQRGPVSLPLPAGPGQLPARLQISMHAGALTVEVDRSGAQPAQRVGLYEDADDPATRLEGYVVAPTADGVTFDVGHRRAEVLQVHCSSTYNAGNIEQLATHVRALQVDFVAGGAPRRLVVLHTLDPGGQAHVACVVVRQA